MLRKKKSISLLFACHNTYEKNSSNHDGYKISLLNINNNNNKKIIKDISRKESLIALQKIDFLKKVLSNHDGHLNLLVANNEQQNI